MSDIIEYGAKVQKVICNSCKHKHHIVGKSTCDAFPDGPIPKDIIMGRNNHLEPLPGQKNKIVFEPLNK